MTSEDPKRRLAAYHIVSEIKQLDDLDLSPFDEKGKKSETRLTDVKAAIGIFDTLRRADEGSAVNRARYDAMFDGAAPYSQAKLDASNQSMKTNLNFNEALRLLDISLSAYVDLYSSLERLVSVRFRSGAIEENERHRLEGVLADELTYLFRSWPEFHSSYLRLCTTFLKHGVGITYFDSPDGWKFRVGGFSDILIPRQTPATEEAIDVAIGRREYHLHELQRFIDKPEAAARVGWNVEEVKRVMLNHVRTTGRNDYSYSSYEELQAEVKNNDIYNGHRNPTVSVLHFWVRELDGSISHFICSELDPKAFMYRKVSRYENAEQAYVFFTNGVGSNGTYHSVRGLGQRIFSHIQTSNRLRCQQIDGAMLSSSLMLQPENERALEELSFTVYGGYTILSPNVNIIEKAIPNLSQAVTPALDDLSQQLALNTDTVSPYGPNQASPYRNQAQVVADMDVATRLSGASLNLFYMSWSRLLREMVRRVVTNAKAQSCPLVKEFHRRLRERGIDPAVLKRLDLSRTSAVRAIGNGSVANRLVALRELQGIAGQFDDVGRRNLTRDIVATRVGHDMADRYAPAGVDERPTVDVKIALLENEHLQTGKPVPVVSNELHGQHLQAHMPAVQQLIEAYNAGQIEDQQLLPAASAFYEHLSQTAQFAFADPNLQDAANMANQLLQYLEEIINNATKAAEAAAREAAESGGAGAGDEAAAVANNAKLEAHQLDMRIKQEKAELDMAIQQRKFEQDQALRDAKAALDFRESSTGNNQPNQPLPNDEPFSAVKVR